MDQLVKDLQDKYIRETEKVRMLQNQLKEAVKTHSRVVEALQTDLNALKRRLGDCPCNKK